MKEKAQIAELPLEVNLRDDEWPGVVHPHQKIPRKKKV